MSNILAIAQKELKSYFASPIAYIVIGFFVLLYGYFYALTLQYFVRESMQMSQMGGPGGMPSMNINERMIRPVLSNVTVELRSVEDPSPISVQLGRGAGRDVAWTQLGGKQHGSLIGITDR